jgi:hypothetical protein
MTSALDIVGAREAERHASQQQQGSEREVIHRARELAAAERNYRMALAQKITSEHASGTAWTVCAELARGDQKVADLRFERDVAAGMKEAADQAAWRHSADRRALGRLVEWSQRIDLRSGGEGEQETSNRLGVAA